MPDKSCGKCCRLTPPGMAIRRISVFSAFAGNPLLISLERLAEQAVLQASDLARLPSFPKDSVDYGSVINLMNTPQFSQPNGNLANATTCPTSGIFNGGSCTPWTIVSQGSFGEVTTLRYASERESQLSMRFTS